MKHTEAIDLLPRTPFLQPEEARALEAHVGACEVCREWLETWELLTDPRVFDGSHLGSEELCAFALETAKLGAEAHKRCRRHVAACPECAEEVELVRASVRESRESHEIPLPFVRLADRPATPVAPVLSRNAWFALAATLALMVGGLVVTDRVMGPVPDDYRLAGDSVQGRRSIETSRSILVEAIQVEAGSVLSLESENIVFGDGFSVDTGAVLVAGAQGNGS